VADRPETAVRLSERLALSISEAARAMGVSERLIRSILSDLPHCHVGNRVVIPVSLLDEWLRKQAQEEQSVVGKAVEEILEEIRIGRN
jgi:excisionase family DNA binding protein